LAWIGGAVVTIAANPELEHAYQEYVGLNGQQDTEGEYLDRWESPTPLDDAERKPFPIHALASFGPFAPFAKALEEFTQTQIDLPATVMLGTLSAAVGGKVVVEVEPGYVEPVNLYLLTLLQSGSRKSAAYRESTAPILRWERERTPEERQHRAVWESRRRIDDAKLKAMEAVLAAPDRRRGKDAPPINIDDVALQAEALARHLATDRPPRIVQVIADDVTAERLASLLAEQDGAVAVMSAEGGFFGNIGGRYNEVPALDTMLKAHAADEIRVDRQGRPGETVPRPALTICITAQPEIAGELGRIPGFRGKGAAARFLVSMPASNLGRRRVSVAPMPPDVTAAWARSVTRLLDLTPLARDADDGYPIPHRLRLSNEAYVVHLAFRQEVEQELGENGLFADITDWASKLPGAAARIAGLLHLLAFPQGSAPMDHPIAGETMTAAITIAEYFAAHALLFFDALAGDDGGALSAARIVLDEICEMAVDAGGESFSLSRRDLNRRLRKRRRFKNASDLDAPLDRLEVHGYIQLTTERTGGRPSKVLHLNPYCQKAHKAQNAGRYDTDHA
jgi:replicative DNA helicase